MDKTNKTFQSAAKERREGDMVGTSYLYRSKTGKRHLGHIRLTATSNTNLERAKRAVAALDAFNAQTTKTVAAGNPSQDLSRL
jgi:hypothetical protein